MEKTMSTIIGASLYEPRKKSDRPELRFLRCKLDGECPLLAKGQCIQSGAILSRGCVYGYVTKEEGYTRRAQKYYSRLKELKEKRKEYPGFPSSAARRLAVVGEYVWVPYDHASMCEAVPFLAHGGAFRLENPYIKVEDFTPEVVVKLARFRPYAMMGGEITIYRKTMVPQFLYHVKMDMPELWAKAVELCPEIEDKVIKPERYKDTPISVTLLSPGTRVTWDTRERDWHGVWDGEKLRMESDEATMVIGIFSYHHAGPVAIEFTPTSRFKVLVHDDDELVRLFEAGKLGALARR
jgi:hypothetical protein